MEDDTGEEARADGARQPPPSPSPSKLDEDMRVRPAKNRLLQVNAKPRRKLFDKARKEVFLEWFAATCNVTLSAAKADVCAETVFRHLQTDEDFNEAFQKALQLGYLRLEARTLQEAHAPAYEVRRLDDEAVEEHFDPELALRLLAQHRRNLPGLRERKRVGAAPRPVSNKEIAEALAKRLKGFALRVDRQKQRETGEDGDTPKC